MLNPFPSLSLSVSSPCKPVHAQTHCVYVFRQSTGKERNDIQFSLGRSRVCSELFHNLSCKSLSKWFPSSKPICLSRSRTKAWTPLTSRQITSHSGLSAYHEGQKLLAKWKGSILLREVSASLRSCCVALYKQLPH